MLLILPVLLISLYLESTITTIPLLLILFSILIILNKDIWIVYLAFFSGLVIDTATMHTPGTTSIFLVCWLFFILLYARKYVIESVPFAIASSFIGSLLYLWILGFNDIIIQSIVSGILGSILFILLRLLFSIKKQKLQLNSITIL